MQESKRGALTVSASMGDKTRDEMKDETGEEMTDETEIKRKTESTASSCRTGQRESRLWLSGVDES
jgi:hypothetical protein